MMLHEPMQVFAGQRTVRDHADVAGPVAELPRFANRQSGRQRLMVDLLELAPTPDAFLKNRMEGQRIEHPIRVGVNFGYAFSPQLQPSPPLAFPRSVHKRGIWHNAVSSAQAREFSTIPRGAAKGSLARFPPFDPGSRAPRRAVRAQFHRPVPTAKGPLP